MNKKKFFFRGIDRVNVKELLTAAGSPRADERLKAVLYMMKMPQNRFKLILPKLINDCNPWVRCAARRLYELIHINDKKDKAEYKLGEKRDIKLIEEDGIYKADKPRHIPSDSLIIDSGKTAVYLKGQVVTLTAAEFRLLMALVRSHGNFVPKNILYCETVDDHAEVGNDTALKTHISRIRIKLGDNGKKPKYILCRKGYGYCLNEKINVQVINKLP